MKVGLVQVALDQGFVGNVFQAFRRHNSRPWDISANPAVWVIAAFALLNVGSASGQGITGGTMGGGNLNQGQLQLQTLGDSIFSANQFQVGSRDAGNFVGGRQAGGDFIGATTAGGQFRRGTITTMDRNNLANQGIGRAAKIDLRNSIRLGFTPPHAKRQQLREPVADRIIRLGRLQVHSPLEVSIEGRTATLRGAVATERERILAEQMVHLEPGVWTVDNQLVVHSEPASDKVLTPSLTAPQ